jgi:hypothetical protein
MAIIFDQGISWGTGVINLAEAVGRYNVFFITHVAFMHSKESLDSITIGDFGGRSGIGILDHMQKFGREPAIGCYK